MSRVAQLAAVMVIAVASGCGSGSGSGASSAQHTTKLKVTLTALLKGMNAKLRPSHFYIVHRVAGGGANIISNDEIYGMFVVEWVPSGLAHTVWTEKGQKAVPITPKGRSGGAAWFGYGSGGLCDYVKSYGPDVFIVYTYQTHREATTATCQAGTAAPHGTHWALVNSTLTKLVSQERINSAPSSTGYAAAQGSATGSSGDAGVRRQRYFNAPTSARPQNLQQSPQAGYG